jgi:hypothetical protein
MSRQAVTSQRRILNIITLSEGISADKAPFSDQSHMTTEIGDLLYVVSLAQNIDRPQDMIPLLKRIFSISPRLDVEERMLFSRAYHDLIVRLRAEIAAVEPYLEVADTPEKHSAVQSLIDRIRSELHSIVTEVIKTTDDVLLPASESTQDHIFYNKLKGDYYRYDAEFQIDDLKNQAIKNADTCYERALSLADEFEISNPMRLGLILNYCVFVVDVKGDKENGRELARTTMERATQKIKELDAQDQDTEICLKLLEDNVRLWKEEDENNTVGSKE